MLNTTGEAEIRQEIWPVSNFSNSCQEFGGTKES